MLGGGTMGGGIAGHLARAGLAVALIDASPELGEQARETLLERTRGHVDAGLLPQEAVARTERVTTPADLEATYLSVFETLERDVGPAFAPPAALRELVEAGRLGAKSGEGFAAYSDDERADLLLDRDRRYAALSRLLEELADGS